MSSMRLFVVSASPPDSSFSLLPMRKSTPQPPGPGLPPHAPSVKISTSGSSVRDQLARKLENHALWSVVGHLLSDVKARLEGVDNFPHQYLRCRRAGGNADRGGLPEPVPVDVGGALDESRRHAQPLGDFGQAERIAAVGSTDNQHSIAF